MERFLRYISGVCLGLGFNGAVVVAGIGVRRTLWTIDGRMSGVFGEPHEYAPSLLVNDVHNGNHGMAIKTGGYEFRIGDGIGARIV